MVRTWSPLVVICVVLAMAAAFLISSRLPKAYEARSTLVVGQSLSAVTPNYDQLLVSQQLSRTYAKVATTRPILDAVIKKLSLGDTVESLGARVHADASTDSALMTITAQDSDPSQAAAIANAVADELIASPAVQGQQTEFRKSVDADLAATQDEIKAIQAEMDALTSVSSRTPAQEAQLQTYQGQLVTLRSTYASLLSFSSTDAPNLLSVIEPAVPANSPVSPRVALNVLLAALLGVLVAVGAAFTAEHLDDRIRDADAVSEVTGLSTLGTLARLQNRKGRHEMYTLATLLYPRSAAAEAYRTLRTNIEFASVDQTLGALLVTSSVHGEGKTVTSCNLAVVFAMAGRRVLLMDADLRRAGVHLLFDLENQHGLTTLLRSDEVSIDSVVQLTEQENLSVLTTGPLPPNPSELLGSQRMRKVVEKLRMRYDLIVCDSPPLQAVTDPAVLSTLFDGTLLIVDTDQSRQGAVRLGAKALANTGARVLGAVLNRAPKAATAAYAGYYSDEGDDEGVKVERYNPEAKESPSRSGE
jgi:non-specific protein-tyrosine kinase